METVVEVGGWEHECCGPAFERDTVVELDCLMVNGQGDSATRYVETRHDLDTGLDTICIRGRVVDISVRHSDGSTEQIERLPSGVALRGFDDADDGHLQRAWSGEPVTVGANDYLVTIAS